MTSILATIMLGLGLFFAVAFVSGNNLSACMGTAIGARVIGRRIGITLGAVGFVLGVLGQGSSMMPTVLGIFPVTDDLLASKVLFVTVIIFLMATKARVPLPLTMSLVGLLVGVSTAHHFAMHVAFVGSIIVVWFVAPAISIILSFYSMRLLDKMSPIDLWRRIAVFKVLLITFSCLDSFVLGANTLGLLVAISGFSNLTLSLAILGILFGCFFLSSGPLRRLGQEIFSLRSSNALVALITTTILVESATLFSIPLSDTQVLSAGVFGTALSYRHKYISAWPFTVIVVGWIIAPLISFLLGSLL